jgi:hypothetical protein
MQSSRSVLSCVYALLAAIILPTSVRASVVFSQPGTSYFAETNLLNFTAPDEALINSLTDGIEIVSFSSVTSSMRASTVGDDWFTWGSPPNTETSTPRVLWSGQDDNFDPVTTVTFLLSVPVSIFGFEAEPSDFGTHTMAATFFMGGTVEQTISLDVSGNSGAMLFAAEADPGVYFDSVTLTSDIDWAAGQFRYGVPEPQSFVTMLAGLGILCVVSKQKRRTP